ncbi:DMT family transporter [Saccharospirillum mangrovi]|uniref:DMT family transporter n=1 Tax=Saccharospirillum mangrovi TaxID=2161747 RepID=UPI000D3326E0|nr:DMT family transporter [Saccharospirillum mangrovi]
MPNTTLRAHLALLLAMLMWGTSFIALKLAVTELAPMIVIFLRMCVGALTFLVVWPWLRHGFNYQKGDWKLLGGMALFEPCLYFIFEAQALKYTSAGQAGMITAMLPLMVAVAAFFLLKERTLLRQWIGFGVAVVGVVAMTLAGNDNDQAPNAILGNVLELLAMVAAVGYTLAVKQLTRRYSAFFITAFQACVGAVFFFPLALMSDWPQQISLTTFGIIVYLGLVATLGAYGLYNYSLTYLKASVSASYTNLLPAFTLMFSMLLLGERVNLWQWLAIGLVFFGVFLSQEKRQQPVPPEAPPPITG